MSATSVRVNAPSSVSTGQAILSGWLLCGVLDITAACVQSWINAGRTPDQVLKGVASALWGSAAAAGGAGMAAIGLLMHFTVALTAPLLLIGPLYGVVVFCAMNYGTLPLMSWVRSFYLGTAPRWPGSMGWPQVLIHMVCVGLPIAWGVRRAR